MSSHWCMTPFMLAGLIVGNSVLPFTSIFLIYLKIHIVYTFVHLKSNLFAYFLFFILTRTDLDTSVRLLICYLGSQVWVIRYAHLSSPDPAFVGASCTPPYYFYFNIMKLNLNPVPSFHPIGLETLITWQSLFRSRLKNFGMC